MTHSRLATPGATIAELSAHGLRTRKALGQHFLIDDNIVGRIIELSAPPPDAAVLEVGPGIGTLTLALCDRAGHVVAVERDRRLQPVLALRAEECPNLSVVFADAVKVAPEDLDSPLGPPVALIANLPYAVAATLVLRFFEDLPSLQSATVMVQAEVADRMTARPGTKDFGSYTVKLGLRAVATGRFAVSRGCFLPPPRVDSAVVRLERLGSPCEQQVIADAARAADAGFAQRRKTLRNSMRSALGVDPATLEQALIHAGIDGSVRAETLPVDVYPKIGAALREYGLLP